MGVAVGLTAKGAKVAKVGEGFGTLGRGRVFVRRWAQVDADWGLKMGFVVGRVADGSGVWI